MPGEPWGWVPYHLGLWMWDQKSGWVWMPGSMFAPAWVDWAFCSAITSGGRSRFSIITTGWTIRTLGLGQSLGPRWGLAHPGTGSDLPPATRPVRSVVTKDGLKKKAQPSLPVPKEMKNALKAAGQALNQGDPGARASLRETMRRSVVISKDDFAKPGWREKTVTVDRFLERPEVKERVPRSIERVPSELVAKDALRSVEAIRTVREVNAEIGPELKNPVTATAPGDPRSGGDRPGSHADAVIQDGESATLDRSHPSRDPAGSREPEKPRARVPAPASPRCASGTGIPMSGPR